MKILKKLFSLLSIFLLMGLMTRSTTLGANAHSGKTDGSGGHTDHDTGEYHYHHGYPAHNHNDMDGDGDIDCPYNFSDKTDHSSGNSIDSNFDWDIDISTLPTFDFSPLPTIKGSSSPQEEQKGESSPTGAYILIGALVLGFWLSPILFTKK